MARSSSTASPSRRCHPPGRDHGRAGQRPELRVGGLISNDTRTMSSGSPGLGDIPILGTLFRSSNFQRNESELVIIVTPYLVRPVREPTWPTPTRRHPRRRPISSASSLGRVVADAGLQPGDGRARGWWAPPASRSTDRGRMAMLSPLAASRLRPAARGPWPAGLAPRACAPARPRAALPIAAGRSRLAASPQVDLAASAWRSISDQPTSPSAAARRPF